MTLRDLEAWTDIDVVQHRISVALGIAPADSTLADLKHVYWTVHPVGDGLVTVINALVDAGVLQRHPDDETVLRWNPAFRGSWEAD